MLLKAAWFCAYNTQLYFLFQESYVTHGDKVRLAGEIISVLGAFAMLFLEVRSGNIFIT